MLEGRAALMPTMRTFHLTRKSIFVRTLNKAMYSTTVIVIKTLT